MHALEFITVEPAEQANGTVIWLHGLGADGHDFTDIVKQLNLPESLQLRFIFPHAPVRSVAINANMQMRAWYDVYSLTDLDQEDEVGIKQSQKWVNRLITQEIQRGIAAERIVIAGFSQGGAVALYTGLHFDEPLAGILALSTYLPLMKSVTFDADNPNCHTPILIAHGRFDPVLPMVLGERTFNKLKQAGCSVVWRDYPMEHQVCLEEIQDISQWLCQIFSTGGFMQ